MVKICVVRSSCVSVPEPRLAADTGAMKKICVVFNRLEAFRKTSCKTPPAAMVVGYSPLKLTALVDAFTRVIVARAKCVVSADDHATTNTVVAAVDLLPAGTVSVGRAMGAV